jgi:hypothetical protein
MKECPYRYVSPELIGQRKMDILRCGINDRHGMVDIDKVCANCKVDKLELDCKHMAPRTRFYLGGGVIPYIVCTLNNATLDDNKTLCTDCKYKE